jgi:hypothetical protein
MFLSLKSRLRFRRRCAKRGQRLSGNHAFAFGEADIRNEQHANVEQAGPIGVGGVDAVRGTNEPNVRGIQRREKPNEVKQVLANDIDA